MHRYSLLLSLFCIVLAACALEVSDRSPTTLTPPAAALRIFNWDTYIDPALLTRFSRETGIPVEYQTFTNNEEMLAAIQAHPEAYDIVVPSDYMVTIMRRKGLLATLNHPNVPNLANIDPLFINQSFDPGNHYCAPYLWGTIGIGYNRTAIEREIHNWSDLFDPTFAGRVALLDDPRTTLGIILLSLGFSPNTTDPVEITAAQNFLSRHANQINTYAPDDGQDLLANGNVDLALEFSGDILQIMTKNPNVHYSIPAEGSLIWIDNMCILRNSPNKVSAERFINFILDPNIGADLASYTRYSSPNIAALNQISTEDRSNQALYPTNEIRERLFFLVDVGGEATELYNEAWEHLGQHR